VDVASIVWLAFFVLFFAAVVSSRRRRRGGSARPGPGTAGTIYDMLNEDKRKAIEIIVEQKAEERDPETADGNLPELESPKRK
jgi:hypothetical protein